MLITSLIIKCAHVTKQKRALCLVICTLVNLSQNDFERKTKQNNAKQFYLFTTLTSSNSLFGSIDACRDLCLGARSTAPRTTNKTKIATNNIAAQKPTASFVE